MEFRMKIISSIPEMKAWSATSALEGKSIGFAPTMGYLHEGHISLMRKARAENDSVVASIFVNPTQFGPHEDLSTYPRDTESDVKKCAEAGVDVLFMPEVNQVYGADHQTFVEVTEVSRPLCGASRPGHFRGVATVVLKLFNIVKPASAYFGMKDYQQLQVITTMVRDLDLNVKIVPCLTVREPDGLAMSSRNSYLSPEQRQQALCLSQALMAAKSLFESGEIAAGKYLEAMEARIKAVPQADPDYIKLVHPESLAELETVHDRAVAILAVRFGKTRLIDNMLFERS